MVLKGLLSGNAYTTAVDLLGKFTCLPCHHVFQPDPTRLVLNLLGIALSSGPSFHHFLACSALSSSVSIS